MYRALRSEGGSTLAELASRLSLPPHECARALRELGRLHLVEPAGTGGTLVPLDTDSALVKLFEAYEARVEEQMEELERFQHSVETLLHQYRPAAMRQSVEVDIEVLPAGKQPAAVHALVSATRAGSWSMHPGPLPSADVLNAALAQDRILIARGVEVRAVYGFSAAAGKRGQRYLAALTATGVDVRLAPQLPFDLVIFDSHTALLPGNPSVPAESALVLRGSRLMPTYVALFEDVWLRASPFKPELPPEETAESPDDKHRAVLRLLANGLTDEQVGRRLGISPRTVGRTVAELMERMGALSRFQMGTLAARAGLLDTSPIANTHPNITSGAENDS
ncbi:helix-turn-helix transcriptional regulator [Streptomyces sp. V4-01]|uniref:Helix-turn-helix transcriptional regulator n=1 Tax=Actinacidiphila polyblastidii TaxID=3110430 RepID=A0ABU7PDT4_9ACTN|nr:helix-turn-helix transcriptional regulator [Streptomyces sp. V4-01]